LVRFQGKHFVFNQIDKNKYVMVEVTTQNSQNGFTQITFPNNADMSEKIFVTKGAYTLLMTMKNKEES
jgi:cobalt-zinc-cadmium efflux system membrane fusion protein